MQSVAQSWLVYRLTGSALLLGLVGFAGQIPVLLLSPIGGVVADKLKERHRGALQINHMVVVKEHLCRSEPEAVREVYRLLSESKRAAGLPVAGELDPIPFGVTANRHNLEIAIDYAYRQRLTPRRLSVDELFDDVTRMMEA